MANGQTIAKLRLTLPPRLSVVRSDGAQEDERIEIRAETGGAIGDRPAHGRPRGVLIVPGHSEPWPHVHEWIRVNYAQDDKAVSAGIQIIAEEVRRVYADKL